MRLTTPSATEKGPLRQNHGHCHCHGHGQYFVHQVPTHNRSGPFQQKKKKTRPEKMAERNFGAKEGGASSSRAFGAAGRQLAHSSPFPHRTEQQGTTERFFSESLSPGSQKAQRSGFGSRKLSARPGDLRGKTSVLVDASRMSDHSAKNKSA